MNRFDREFEVKALEGDTVKYLFSKWMLPGEKPDSDQPALRIGIRNGYLNLYVCGQSVAKVSIGREGPFFEVHPKYVAGHRKPPIRSAVKQAAQRPIRLKASEISEDEIDCWIATASTYASEEKAFVEHLVAANPGVIDLEMGLPALGGERSAPRMDLVAAQDGNVVFWEAKCCGNSELRAAGERSIPVVSQLRKYVDWMDDSRCDNRSDVLVAYRKTARLLLLLAAQFQRTGERAIDAWQQLADNDEARLILAPGLVVADYNALSDKDCTRTVTNNASYLKTLRTEHGVIVHCVANEKNCILPALAPHVVRA